jgi:hypothetical protein
VAPVEVVGDEIPVVAAVDRSTGTNPNVAAMDSAVPDSPNDSVASSTIDSSKHQCTDKLSSPDVGEGFATESSIAVENSDDISNVSSALSLSETRQMTSERPNNSPSESCANAQSLDFVTSAGTVKSSNDKVTDVSNSASPVPDSTTVTENLSVKAPRLLSKKQASLRAWSSGQRWAPARGFTSSEPNEAKEKTGDDPVKQFLVTIQTNPSAPIAKAALELLSTQLGPQDSQIALPPQPIHENCFLVGDEGNFIAKQASWRMSLPGNLTIGVAVFSVGSSILL